MPSFAEGFATGFMNTQQAKQQRQNAAAASQQQELTNDRLERVAQATIGTNVARQQKLELETQNLQRDQDFENGVIIAAEKGGLPAVIDFATKTGRYDYVLDIQNKQAQLNKSIAQATLVGAQGEKATTEAVTMRTKALAGVSQVLYKNIEKGMDPESAYNQALPSIKELWPNAPEKWSKEADDYMKIGLAQHLPQATKYAAYGAIGQSIAGYEAAQSAGDDEAANFFRADIQKKGSIIDPLTGNVMSFIGAGVPESHQGSVDAKASAAGLAAGSTTPPTGVAFIGQPTNNGIAREYEKYDLEHGIQPQDRMIRNLKPGAGWETVQHPDGTTEQRPIPGGAASKLTKSGAEAVKIAQLANSQKVFNSMYDMLVKQDASGNSMINRSILSSADVLGSGVTIPFSKGSTFKNLMNNLLESYARSLSGAQIPEAEWATFRREVEPGFLDNDETVKNKMLILHEILTGSIDILVRGRDANVIKDTKGNGRLDWDKLDTILKASANGGSPLDVTRGDGFNPDTMRANKQKQLSYDPRQIEYYMDPAHNGQGRSLSQAEAKQLIDQISEQQRQGDQR